VRTSKAAWENAKREAKGKNVRGCHESNSLGKGFETENRGDWVEGSYERGMATLKNGDQGERKEEEEKNKHKLLVGKWNGTKKNAPHLKKHNAIGTQVKREPLLSLEATLREKSGWSRN